MEIKMHNTTFEYLKPTEEQQKIMAIVRGHFMDFSANLELFLPDGPDKTYLLRKLREVAMWANVAITRNSDGSPRI
jgi:hypothetical protein